MLAVVIFFALFSTGCSGGRDGDVLCRTGRWQTDSTLVAIARVIVVTFLTAIACYCHYYWW